jgi:hypothetical protein
MSDGSKKNLNYPTWWQGRWQPLVKWNRNAIWCVYVFVSHCTHFSPATRKNTELRLLVAQELSVYLGVWEAGSPELVQNAGYHSIPTGAPGSASAGLGFKFISL